MKTKNFAIAALLITAIFITLLVSSSVYAWPWQPNTCRTSYQIRPGNQINFQIPHFVCCQCNEHNEDCECGNDLCLGNSCKHGDMLSKHITLIDEQECGAHAESDISVYNYNGLDKLKLVLRASGLPKNKVFTAWLVYADGGSLNIGKFRTNLAGRGQLTFNQKMLDFNSFDRIVVMSNGVEYLSGNLNFKCMTNYGDEEYVDTGDYDNSDEMPPY